ncbi:unnamed protein product [Cylicocyclus nassatus]|uniref:Uncharacterized protein n=1 Tax=Cylicocyclus nassatus TaxID=53992 RepID=A0AA36GN25_CYLNA|nr:unnamed protein product [Cylicocyclus nassatus]
MPLRYVIAMHLSERSKMSTPLALLLDQGCHRAFWINSLLTLLLYVPGVIHAFKVILAGGRHHYDHHDHLDHYGHHQHHHHREEVFVVQPQTHYIAQPVVIQHGAHAQPVVGQGVVSNQSQSIYPDVN